MFSKSTEYALRATIFIAQKGAEENKLGLAAIAKAIGSPKSFTAKILQQLTKGNTIICSVTGPGGGFYVPDAAKKLPIMSILQVMGENEMLSKCVLGLKKCSDTQPCPMHYEYQPIKQKFLQLFQTKTIGQLALEMKSGDVFIKAGK